MHRRVIKKDSKEIEKKENSVVPTIVKMLFDYRAGKWHDAIGKHAITIDLGFSA